MDEAVRKIAALGLPGVVLLIAMATTGFTGAAAITAALAMLGPGGMIGGIMFLGVIGIATDALCDILLHRIRDYGVGFLCHSLTATLPAFYSGEYAQPHSLDVNRSVPISI